MFSGSLETLCLGIFALLLILLAFLIVLAVLRRVQRTRKIPGRLLTHDGGPPMTADTVLKLNYYYPLPDGFAYTEGDEGAPAIVRIDDGISLPYLVQEDRLTFEEPHVREDGTVTIRTHEVFRRGHYTSANEPIVPEA